MRTPDGVNAHGDNEDGCTDDHVAEADVHVSGGEDPMSASIIHES